MFKVRFGSTGPLLEIPAYPRLQAYTTEQAQLQSQLEACLSRRSLLENEGRAIEAATPVGLEATASVYRRRAEIVNLLKRVDDETLQLQYELDSVQQQQRDLLELTAAVQLEIQELKKALGTTVNEEFSETREKLLVKTTRLAALSGDSAIVKQAGELEKEIEASRSYVILRECYYRLPDGAVISESTLNEYARQKPNSVLGATTIYGKNFQLPKTEAKQLGII